MRHLSERKLVEASESKNSRIMNRASICIAAIVALIGTSLPAYSKRAANRCNFAKTDKRVVNLVQDVGKGSIIEMVHLKTSLVDGRMVSAESIYDPFIAVGRPSMTRLRKGLQLRFDQCFSKSYLGMKERIDHLQGRFSLSMVENRHSMRRKIPVLEASRTIQAGERIELSDLRIAEVEVQRAPAQGVGDIWIVIGRQSLGLIKAGEVIEYRNVIPRFRELFYGEN